MPKPMAYRTPRVNLNVNYRLSTGQCRLTKKKKSHHCLKKNVSLLR